jgi:hypothetical protein
MKIESDKIQFKKVDEHVSLIFHETDMIRFWTPDLYVPFGVDENFGKYTIQLVVDKDTPQHTNLKKIIEKVEKVLIKRLKLKSGELKSIFRRKMGDFDMLDIRLKQVKGKMICDYEYENKKDNYLKTIYDMDKESRVKVYLEVHGFWDYRENNQNITQTTENIDKENQNLQENKVGLIVNILKMKILDKKDAY